MNCLVSLSTENTPACAYCGKGVGPGNNLRDEHDVCWREDCRRVDAGKCVYCGVADADVPHHHCAGCRDMEHPKYLDYPGEA